MKRKVMRLISLFLAKRQKRLPVVLTMEKVKSVLLVSLLLVTVSPKEVLCQNVVADLYVNPIPNIISHYMGPEMQGISGVLEIGEPYLAVRNVKYKYSPPICLFLDYATIDESTVWAIRLGQKRYWSTKDKFYLRGQSAMLSFGGLYAKKSDQKGWGLVAALRTGYKFLFFSRLITEPFFEWGVIYSKLIEPDFNVFYTLGVNVGFRLAKPNY